MDSYDPIFLVQQALGAQQLQNTVGVNASQASRGTQLPLGKKKFESPFRECQATLLHPVR